MMVATRSKSYYPARMSDHTDPMLPGLPPPTPGSQDPADTPPRYETANRIQIELTPTNLETLLPAVITRPRESTTKPVPTMCGMPSFAPNLSLDGTASDSSATTLFKTTAAVSDSSIRQALVGVSADTLKQLHSPILSNTRSTNSSSRNMPAAISSWTTGRARSTWRLFFARRTTPSDPMTETP